MLAEHFNDVSCHDTKPTFFDASKMAKSKRGLDFALKV